MDSTAPRFSTARNLFLTWVLSIFLCTSVFAQKPSEKDIARYAEEAAAAAMEAAKAAEEEYKAKEEQRAKFDPVPERLSKDQSIVCSTLFKLALKYMPPTEELAVRERFSSRQILHEIEISRRYGSNRRISKSQIEAARYMASDIHEDELHEQFERLRESYSQQGKDLEALGTELIAKRLETLKCLGLN